MRILMECAVVAVLGMLVSVMAPSQGTAQIPNPGFETWDVLGNPEGWSGNIPGFASPVTASNTRHGGLFAARGEVISVSDLPYTPPLSSTFPVTQLPQRLQLYYQFAPLGGDELMITMWFWSGSTPIGVGDTVIVAPAGTWTLLDLPVETVLPGTPQSCQIVISIGNSGPTGDPTIGSAFIVDDLAFSDSPTAVPIDRSIPYAFALDQNYPNPFNPSTSIEYSLPDPSQVRLDVFNAIGERVATLVDTRQDAGKYRARFDASALPSGVYLYRLTAGADVSVKRMILMK